jgi:hypothetical protein
MTGCADSEVTVMIQFAERRDYSPDWPAATH